MDETLSCANIEFLKKEIGRSGLTYSHLLDELIDHVCCDVEYEMANGIPFAKAYERVRAKIGIGGLERIQHETLYLIDKKYRIMKNTMKISGVIAPIFLAFGSLFKIQHWPAAGILLVLGFFMLSFVFLPSAVYVSYKEVSNYTKKWTHIIGFLGTFILSVGFLFKVQHWPGAGIGITLGIVIICLIFLPMVIINRLRDDQDSVPKYVFATALLGLMLLIAGFMFKIQHWNGSAVLMLAGSVLLVFIAFPVFVFKSFKNEPHVSNSFIFIVLVLIWFVVPITLISLNLSRNVINATYETSQCMDTDYKFIKESNDLLFSKMKGNPRAIAVTKSANELLEYIQNIKEEMVIRSNAGNAVLGNRLKELLSEFENQALALSPDAGYASIIRKTTKYEVNPEENREANLLMQINKLSFLQLNICLAEQTALMQLSHSGQESAIVDQTLTIQ
jgi:hypothetical protein